MRKYFIGRRWSGAQGLFLAVCENHVVLENEPGFSMYHSSALPLSHNSCFFVLIHNWEIINNDYY